MTQTECMSRENQVQWKRSGAGEGEKGKNVEKFLCRAESFQVPLIISQHCLKTSPSFPLLLPPTLNNFHVGSQESQNLSPCYQSVTFPIYLLHCCQSIFLNTSLIIVSAAYLTKSQTQHGTQGLRSSGANWTVPIPSPFCISSCSTACFPISFSYFLVQSLLEQITLICSALCSSSQVHLFHDQCFLNFPEVKITRLRLLKTQILGAHHRYIESEFLREELRSHIGWLKICPPKSLTFLPPKGRVKFPSL